MWEKEKKALWRNNSIPNIGNFIFNTYFVWKKTILYYTFL